MALVPGVRAQPLPGQVVASPDRPQWLQRQGGGPLFLCGPGDPEDFLYRGTLNPDGTRRGDQMELIEKLRGTGANCIYLQAVRSHGGDGDATHNPFRGHDPARGVNPLVLEQWETWFAEMDRYGIVILLFIYDDSSRIWDTGDEVGQEEAAFIRTLVNRFKHHLNLIWCVAEEYQEAYSAQRVRRIAAAIRAADDHRHPVAVHQLDGLDFSALADDPHIDQFAIQYNVETPAELHDGMVAAWRDARGRYNLNMSECAHHSSGATARRMSWAAAMGGAYVMALGMDIAATPLSDLEDCGRLVRFFEATTFDEMGPHDELAHAGADYVLARPGHSYIAYAADLQGEIGIKDMTAGIYDLLWFDCVSGRSLSQTGVRVETGNRAWHPPAGFGTEVALYLRRDR